MRKRQRKGKSRKEISKKVKKAFILTSVIGAVIKVHHNGDPRFDAIAYQVDRAMKVFAIKAGIKLYNELSLTMQRIWVEIDEDHQNPITLDEVAVCIEMLYHMIPYEDMKTFLNVGYTTSHKVRDEMKSSLLCMMVDMDQKINQALGMKPYIDRNGLGAIMCKPVPVKKAKGGRKELTKAQKRHLEMVEEHRCIKERRKALLAGIREKAERLRAERSRKEESA